MANQPTKRKDMRYLHEVPNTNLIEIDDYPEHPEGATPRFVGPGKLWVEGMNMLIMQNKFEHHTDLYKTDKLVVRRGQPFRIIVNFSQDISSEDVQLEFLIGSNPNLTEQSRVIVSFGWHSYNKSSWKGQPMEQYGSVLELVVHPSPRAIVGKYRCYVVVNGHEQLVRSRRNEKTDVYMLFNPWCPEDCAYYPAEKQQDLQEYVLNPSGVIYSGTFNSTTYCFWEYSQFEAGVLDACIYILDAGHMPIRSRADLLSVIRKASAMLNAQDDAGVLVGKWGTPYPFGTAPGKWVGSKEILLEYARTGNPVRYGQCWVFAGVFTTFLRCLGIASRCITNFNSAHDNTGNLRVDLIYHSNGTADTMSTRDSIWNFHCWNEVYMARVDLPPAFSGWQAVDATPQETSDGKYRCGPASVHAVKTGQICYGHDSGFILAEVNSDVVYQRYEDSEYKVFRVVTDYVGKLICTKSVGSNEMIDITHDYKYPEGTIMNQESLNTAEAFGMMRDHSVIEQADYIRVTIMSAQVYLGDTIHMNVTIRNLTSDDRHFKGGLDVLKIYYTGIPEQPLLHEDIQTEIKANDVWQAIYSLSREDYHRPDSSDTHTLQATVSGKVDSQLTVETRLIEIKLKAPVVQVTGDFHVRGLVTVTLSFTNDTGDTLSDIDLAITGTDLAHSIVLHFDAVDVNETISQKVQIMLEHTGHYTFTGKVMLEDVYEASESQEFDVTS